MPSSEQDRLTLVYKAFKDALKRRPADLRDAKTVEDAQAVIDNVETLRRVYLDAAQKELDGTGQAIESAYEAAVAAKKAVDDAYAQSKAVAERIRAVGALATKAGELVAKAAAHV